MDDLWQSEDVLFVPLGGCGEIGMNANLFHYQGRWLLVDLGISFADESMPGVDIILPDLSFIEEHNISLDGIVLTHGHEDHLGAVQYLWEKLKCPIYGTPFTLALLKGKLREYLPDAKVKLITMGFNEPMAVGSFEVEFISLTHSIPDPAGLVLRAGEMTLFHTGDWKFDKTPRLGEVSDMDALQKLGEQGVDVLLGDSTNAMEEGRTGSESDAYEALVEAIAKEQNRVAVTCFASNVARVDSLIKAAHATGRTPMLVGRALHRVTEAAHNCGYLGDWPDIADEDDFDLLPRGSVLMICTGSQGEARSALARIASGAHHVSLEAGDTVMFSSREIPGNEIAIGKVQDKLVRRGIKVITDREEPIHVSGHPARGEIAEMYQLIRPNIAIPVHGTMRHMAAHGSLAMDCQVQQTLIPENGAIIRLSKNRAEQLGKVNVSLMTVAGSEVVSFKGAVMRERRRLLYNGMVSVSLVFGGDGKLSFPPQIQQSGLAEGESAEGYISAAEKRIKATLKKLDKVICLDDEELREIIMRDLRGLAREMFEARPLVQVHILRGK